MKAKRICLFFLLAALAVLTFSTLVEETEATPTDPAVILRANPSTGYTWTATVADEDIVSIVDSGFVQDAAEEGATGVGGFLHFAFQGKAEGCTTVSFAYGRAWETEAPLYTLVYDIAVDSGMKVTITATTFTDGAME